MNTALIQALAPLVAEYGAKGVLDALVAGADEAAIFVSDAAHGTEQLSTDSFLASTIETLDQAVKTMGDLEDALAKKGITIDSAFEVMLDGQEEQRTNSSETHHSVWSRLTVDGVK